MWYKNWFDSDYYHLLYKNRDEEEAERFIDAITTDLELQPGSRILDLPCGRGRHSVYLASKGFDVTGADLAPSSIEFAKTLATEHLHFRVHDMLQPFPEKNFDAVFNLFTSFGYFENENDDLKVLSNMKAALRPGGILLIDFLNPTVVRRVFIEEQHLEECGVDFRINKKIENGFVYKDVTITTEDDSYHYNERVRLFELDDFQRLLNATGLQIITTFGSYSLSPYSKDDSERMIIVAKN